MLNKPPSQIEPEITTETKLLQAFFVKLCLAVWRDPYGAPVWRSEKIDDPNFFYLGIGFEPGEQMRMIISYHLWELTSFAKNLDEPPTFDGHTDLDILPRLNKFLRM
jgi:hypothetical protein